MSAPKPGVYVNPNWHGGRPLVAIYGNGDLAVVAEHIADFDGTDRATVQHDAARVESLFQSWKVVPAQVVPADAIVIRREELPGVKRTERGLEVEGVGGYFNDSDDYAGFDARAYGLALIATQEFRRERPPVDEAQVEALDQIIPEVESAH